MKKNKSTHKIVNFNRFAEAETAQNKTSKKGIYLLPNLLTTGALFAGFYAIILGFGGRFELAVIAIFAAMFFDGLDGRVARLTNTQSDFGVQYDSLSDMVSFGIAPAVVVFSWGLSQFGKLGFAASFVYASCAALRLARYNVQSATLDKNFFNGLPSPAAAGLMAGFVWSTYELQSSVILLTIGTLLTIIAGLLMVSNFKYPSFKAVDLRGKVPFVVMLLAVVSYAVITIHPPIILFSLALVFSFSAPVIGLYKSMRAYFSKNTVL